MLETNNSDHPQTWFENRRHSTTPATEIDTKERQHLLLRASVYMRVFVISDDLMNDMICYIGEYLYCAIHHTYIYIYSSKMKIYPESTYVSRIAMNTFK